MSDWEDIAVGPPASSGDWEDVAFGPAAEKPFSLSNEILSVGNRAVEGVGDLLDFADNLNPMAIGGPRLFGLNPLRQNEPTASEQLKPLAESAQLYGPEKADTSLGRVAERVAYFAPSAVVPGGSAAARIASAAGSGVASGITRQITDSPTADAIASLFGGMAPSLVGSAAGAIADKATKGADALELRAFGGTKAKVLRAINRMPDLLDETGDFENPLGKAIGSFRDMGGGSAGMSGEALLRDLEGQTAKVAGELSDELAVAQAKQTDIIIPKFSKTKAYIDGLAGADKEAASKIAEKAIKDTVDNTDGTLLSLQSEKVKLGQSIAESAWGEDVAGRLRNNVLKRVRADLRTTIENSYETLTGKSSDTIAKLNEKIGQRQGLYPLFKDILASDESRDILSSAIQSMRTSGGVGVLAAGAAYGAGGPLAGAATVAGNMLLQTPTGKKILADTVSNAVKAAKSVALPASGTLLRPLVPLASESNTGPEERQVQPKATSEGQNTVDPTQAAQTRSSPYSLFNPASLTDSPAKESAIRSLFKRGNMDTKEALSRISADPYYAALAQAESNFNPKATNSESSAKGLFQLVNATAKSLGVRDPFDIGDSFEGVQKLTNDHIKRFGDDPATLYSAHYLGATLLKKVLAGADLTNKEQSQVDYLKSKALPRFMKIYDQISTRAVEV